MTRDSYEKRIDGKNFYGVDFLQTKSAAQDVAEKWRKRGHKARVIQEDVFQVVYIYPPP